MPKLGRSFMLQLTDVDRDASFCTEPVEGRLHLVMCVHMQSPVSLKRLQAAGQASVCTSGGVVGLMGRADL